MLRDYIVQLQERKTRYAGAKQRPKMKGGLSLESIAGHIRALHRFWRWVAAEYNVPNPMTNIRRPKRKFPKPKGVNLTDVEALLGAASHGRESVRDQALIAFLFDTGCRVQGLIRLEPGQLDMVQRSALVQEKETPMRVVFFSEQTAELLAAYLAERPEGATAVFCSRLTGKALTVSGVNQLLKRLKLRAGITGRVNPHAFRHGFAREYIMNGGDLATLSQIMGHSNVTTTASYYAVFSHAELATKHNRFTPVKRLKFSPDSEDES
ncbi:MAG: tyrosine-type recombinase/integrase [Anaerolineaceae bacterium]|nr:tyrosine-type recombinase/integrase [Anaerolineaceae bacterium]